MAVLYLDSFATYNTAGIGQNWSQITNNSSINATAGRRGGPAITGVNSCFIQRAIPASATIIFGAAFKVTNVGISTNDFIAFYDSSTIQVKVEYFNGVLRITGPSGVLATGATTLVSGGIYYI